MTLTLWEVVAWVITISSVSFMFGGLWEWRKQMKEQEKEIKKKLKGGEGE